MGRRETSIYVRRIVSLLHIGIYSPFSFGDGPGDQTTYFSVGPTYVNVAQLKEKACISDQKCLFLM